MTRNLASHACDRARAQISSRIDDELSELEEARLGVHLAGCAACRAYEADVVAVTVMMRAAPLEPLEFPVAVSRRRRSALRQFELAAAVTMAAAIGLGSLFSTLGTSRPSVFFGSSERATRPAYLDSADYEQRLIEQAIRNANNRVSTGGVIHI
jgi:predicted anti-sigma-YlaC factor YlaD